MILVDAHVHIYDCFQLDKFLDATLDNIKSVANRFANYDEISSILLLTETAKEDWFSQVLQYTREATVNSGKNIGNWTFHSTGEICSVLAQNENDEILILIAGRQIQTLEGLELLALCMNGVLKDGEPMRNLIEIVKSRGGIPVIPWGFGKWFGKRGLFLRDLLESDIAHEIFLGDNSGRPVFFPEPLHFKLAKKKGISILPGTDPLPFETEFNRAGSFGFCFQGSISGNFPTRDLKYFLLDKDFRFMGFGELEKPFRFLRNQFAMQLKKHFKKQ